MNESILSGTDLLLSVVLVRECACGFVFYDLGF